MTRCRQRPADGFHYPDRCAYASSVRSRQGRLADDRGTPIPEPLHEPWPRPNAPESIIEPVHVEAPRSISKRIAAFTKLISYIGDVDARPSSRITGCAGVQLARRGPIF